MSEYRINVHEDVNMLVVLLHRLGLKPGPVKAAHVEDLHDRIEVLIWFVAHRFGLVKAKATLVAGCTGAGDETHRRVYLNLRVVMAGENRWTYVVDSDFISAGLEPSWKYAGEESISFDFDPGRGEFSSEGAYRFPFYAHKPGDRERAEKLAHAEARRMRAEWERAVANLEE
jgi:hypothetical protein